MSWKDTAVVVKASAANWVERRGPNGFHQIDVVELVGFRPQVIEFCETNADGCNCVIGGEYIVGVESPEHAAEILTALRVAKSEPTP